MKKEYGHLSKAFAILLSSTVLAVLLLIPLSLISIGLLEWDDLIPKSELEKALETDFFTRNYDVSTLSPSEESERIKYGYELITNTPEYLGPDNAFGNETYTSNHMKCQNCHLSGGTKEFAAPYIGVTKSYPQFRGREGQIGTIEDRINGCMERSMNGSRLPNESREMQAMVAYMEWLSRDMPEEYVKEYLKGRGFKAIQIPNRRVDLKNGQVVYQKYCTNCHGIDGLGQWNEDKKEYTYPALSGEHTYNHGAGMNRVLTAAQFIKYNMPYGVTANSPKLTDGEAYDVAGYINSFNRPVKTNTEEDFPDLKLKPVSTPYPPYADHYSQDQHKYGPFNDIIEYYQKKYSIKKTK